MLTVLRNFIRAKREDVFNGTTRRSYADSALYGNKTAKTELMSRPKHVPASITTELKNPFELSNIEKLTEIQAQIVKDIKSIKYCGSFGYSCSCGSGKTLAGVYCIHYLKCKTLIISSKNSVNDQWKRVIETLYPDLVINNLDGLFKNGNKVSNLEPDIYIVSPQYLHRHMDIDIHPGLIIYDEVHSLLSEKFSAVLSFPFLNVINKKYTELPYLLALSATYPEENQKEIKILQCIFGEIISVVSDIIDIPVRIHDYRLHFLNKGPFDKFYTALTDTECAKYYLDRLNKFEIDVSDEYKGIIITHLIDTSVYAALYAWFKFKINVLIIRESNSSSLFISKDASTELTSIPSCISLTDLKKMNICEECKYMDKIDQCSIICGTYQRLKEGFSCESLTWGICTEFVYSVSTRTQIIGRIRRKSKNETLNSKPRIMLVCSHKIPTDSFKCRKLHKYNDVSITYPEEYERTKFEKENYIYI